MSLHVSDLSFNNKALLGLDSQQGGRFGGILIISSIPSAELPSCKLKAPSSSVKELPLVEYAVIL
jgi:hypothetical protein